MTVRVPTGIKRLDTLLEGGIPAGAAVLVYGPPFLGKEVLARRFILAGLAAGLPSVYVLTNQATEDVRRDLQAADPKYEYTYTRKSDAKGNWTEERRSRVIVYNGKRMQDSQYAPEITKREFIYY